MFATEPMYKRPNPPVETVTTMKQQSVDPLCGVLVGSESMGSGSSSSEPASLDCRRRPRPGSLYCTGESSSTVASFACHSSRSLATTANTSLSNSQHDEDRPRKHVEFHPELETLAVDADGELTAEEMLAVWWQIPDFKNFRRFCRKEARRAAEEPGFIDDFQYVYEACHSGNLLKQLQWHSEHGTSSAPKARSSVPAETASLTDCIRIVNTPYRGLEMAIFRPLLKDRRTAIRTVLAIQDKLPATKSLQEREVILASKSRFLTRKARQMARVMGSADSDESTSEFGGELGGVVVVAGCDSAEQAFAVAKEASKGLP